MAGPRTSKTGAPQHVFRTCRCPYVILCHLIFFVPVRSPYILYNSLQLFTFSNFPRFFRWFRRCCRNKHLGCAPAFDCDNDLETWVRLTACCGLWWTVRNWDQKKLDYLLLHWMNWNESLLSGDKLEPHQEEMVSNSAMDGFQHQCCASQTSSCAGVGTQRRKATCILLYARPTEEDLRGSWSLYSTFQNENQKSHAVCIQQST